jgi:hypothetical protein
MRRPFSHPALLRYYAWVIRSVWYIMAIALVMIVASHLFYAPMFGIAMALLFGAFGLAVLHLPLLLFLRCPHCNRIVAADSWKSARAGKRNKGGLAPWARVLMHASRGEDFVCIHCGSWVGLSTDRYGLDDFL